MSAYDSINDDRIDMLKRVSKRNVHIPLSDLVFMLDLLEDPHTEIMSDLDNALYEYGVD